MARNGIAKVDWPRIGEAVLAYAEADIASNGATGFRDRVIHHFAAERLTYTRLDNYLANVAGWKARKARAVSAFDAHQPLPAPAPPPPPPTPVDPVTAELDRREKMRVLREQKELLNAVAGEQSLRGYLTKLAEATAQRIEPPPPYEPPSAKPDTSRESMVMQWSDWHAYEVVKAERTRGFNSYDHRVFGQRVKALVEAHGSIKRRMERGGGWQFDRLHLAVNGDMVSGTIHEAERHSDAPHIVQAVYGCATVLAAAIRDVSAEYRAVDVYGTTGNHGRFPDAKRMQQKDPTRSWDALIYILAREMLRDVVHVTWHIPDAYSVAFDVEGWTFLQTHGHDIKSWNSIPHYGINRYVGNINALEASRGQQVSFYLFGHFHAPSSLEHASGESFVNGCLIGGTEYGINTLGKSGPPCQWMLGVHPKHGVTHRWQLLGRHPVDANAEGYPSAPWGEAA